MRTFPYSRLRRVRKAPWVRNLVAEHSFTAHDLILPMFIIEGKNQREAINSMPDLYRLSIDQAVLQAKEARSLGIPAIALFPKIDDNLKCPLGKEAINPDNLICRAIQEIKHQVPEIGVICDVALDPYTSHGHDGILDKAGYVTNDESVAMLVKQAEALAKAGVDVIAPSDMMDGRIAAIREMLEDEGYFNTLILAYSAKYSSCFYGPFRDAVASKKLLGNSDKKTYQMNPANALEAMDEIEMDIAEGADLVMIKPGLPYLDIIKAAKDSFSIPIFAYQVSGEYSMIKFAAQAGAIDETRAFHETMLAFKRAGCSGILTYAALDIAKSIG